MDIILCLMIELGEAAYSNPHSWDHLSRGDSEQKNVILFSTVMASDHSMEILTDEEHWNKAQGHAAVKTCFCLFGYSIKC